jgi:hypothetical protein
MKRSNFAEKLLALNPTSFIELSNRLDRASHGRQRSAHKDALPQGVPQDRDALLI